jgi:citrate lyase subunit beta/citryl-CoA lyase/(S)-citramalyl-CoA lyase
MFYRSLLFVPGNRPDRFDKACAAGADLVVIDLEDAVGPNDKDTARDAVIDWLSNNDNPSVGVRINGVDTREFPKDTQALAESGLSLPFVMLPKPDTKADIQKAANALPDRLGTIAPVMESGMALLNAADIFSHERLDMCLFGGVDFSADIGSTLEWDALLTARSTLAMAAAAHNVLVFDVPYLDLRDPDGCETETRRVKDLGIPARSAIHPAQIEPIHKALSPSADEINYAERLVAAYEEAKGNVALLDGKLIEAPLMKKAQRILAFKE